MLASQIKFDAIIQYNYVINGTCDAIATTLYTIRKLRLVLTRHNVYGIKIRTY